MSELPWRDLPCPDPSSKYTYRLADLDHPFEFFWARDRDGSYAFRFKGKFLSQKMESAPQMSGISTSHDEFDGWSYLNLTLEHEENAELFLTLCRNLMSATSGLREGQYTAAVDVILTRLQRWQELLEASKAGLLSVDAQLGLFGELIVLRDVFLENLDPYEAVSSWNGPLGDEQDFGYGDSLVEVKSTRSTRDQSFVVSSLDQLDTASGEVTVVFQTLGVFENDPPTGCSLNRLVGEIRAGIGAHAAALAEFETRLTLSRYFVDPAYDRHHFVAASRRFFAVRDEFPRIELRDVRQGIERASYRVRVEACLEYELDDEAAVSRILSVAGPHRAAPVRISPSDLVQMPESSELEFKSSLRWSYQEGKVNSALEAVVLKTISAFANTRGGRLVIGVDNNNRVLGLEADYRSLNKHQDRDGFEQHLMQLLLNEFGAPFCARNISVEFHDVGGEVCVVNVRRADRMVPVEKRGRDGSKTRVFFVRTGNSSRELSQEELLEFAGHR